MNTIYYKHPASFFVDKQVVATRDIHNRSGECIFKGEVVTITKKFAGFSIRNSRRISIYGADPAAFEFVQEFENKSEMNKIIELFQYPRCKKTFSSIRICKKHILRGCNASLEKNHRNKANQWRKESSSSAHRSCKKGIWD